MSKHRCGVVVSARDEEDVIESCLRSIRLQTTDPFIVVVNDGSVDETKVIASNYADLLVNLPGHSESWAGKPELARVFNAGFGVLRDKEIEYIMISGADAVYPPDYLEEILSRMKRDRVVIASGVSRRESSNDKFPRGTGRVLETDWFKGAGFEYPENYGFEGYLIYKALSKGYKVNVYPDIKFQLSRITQLTNNKLFLWGKGMRAMNYSWWYALGRALKMALRYPSGGYQLLKGYFYKVHYYEDIKDFVPRYQRKMILARGKKVIMDVFR